MSYALKVRTGSPIQKLTLLALADCHNSHTGRCDPRLGHLERATQLSERTLRRATESLVEDGILARTRKRGADGQLGGYDYSFPGLEVRETASQRSERPVGAVRLTGQDLELGSEPGTSVESPNGDSPSEAECAIFDTCPIRPPANVNRKKVSQVEGHLSIRVLQAFNEIFEARPAFTATDWCAKIIMRLREHPDVSLEEHRDIIVFAHDHPWWEGPASPSVIYGNAGLFEQRMAAVHAPATVNGNGKLTAMELVRRSA